LEIVLVGLAVFTGLNAGQSESVVGLTFDRIDENIVGFSDVYKEL